MPRILLIDDDLTSLEVFRLALRRNDHSVATARSGAEGLATLGRQGADVVVAEVQLPDMSGLDVLRAIRERQQPQAVLFAARAGTPRDAVTAMRQGADDFLAKPVGEDALRGAIDRALQSRSAADPAAGGDRQLGEMTSLAKALATVIECPQDVRTFGRWSQWVATPPDTLRRWCHAAGVPPRAALIFARVLRAVPLMGRSYPLMGRGYPLMGRGYELANLLDVVDRRTLIAMLRLAGFADERDVPDTIDAYLERQTLLRDAVLLDEVRRAARSHVAVRGRTRPYPSTTWPPWRPERPRPPS
jgi:DNA-binding response OmpR family regulator